MSKTIGNMTLKATPVGNDAVAIADSEDSDKTKKVLLSSISGGGSNVHIATSATWSSPNYNVTIPDVTQYENGHLYIIQFPSALGSSTYPRYININNLGAVELDYNYSSYAPDNGKFMLPDSPESSILIYRTGPTKFYFIGSTYSQLASHLCATNYVWAGTSIILDREYVYQNLVMYNTPSVSITITLGKSSMCHTCTTPLTSLTLRQEYTMRWETEIDFTTDSTFTFTENSLSGYAIKWIGAATPTFDPNTSYVIKIKNGYGYVYKVGA